MSFNSFIKKIKEIKTRLKKTPKILIKEFLKESFFEDLIFALISERITKTGTDSKGEKLRTDGAIFSQSFGGGVASQVYSPANKKKKDRNHVDLYETGHLLNSGKLIVTKNKIVAKYDLKKSDGSVYDNFQLSYSSKKEFEEVVFSIDADELKIINDHLYRRIIKYYATILK